METDERLIPIPEVTSSRQSKGLQKTNQEYPSSYAPFNDEESFSNQRSFREYVNIVYKRLPYVLALTILTTAAAAFYMYRQPSIFKATTGMQIEPQKTKPQETQSVNINFGDNKDYHNTQLLLLKNPELMQDVVVRLGLHDNPNLLDGQRKSVMATIRSIFSGGDKTPKEGGSLPVINPEDSDVNGTDKETLTPEQKQRVFRYAAHLSTGLAVDQIEFTNLFEVTVTNTDPVLAAKTADMLATIFIEQDIDKQMGGAKKSYQELSKSIEDLKTSIASQDLQYFDNLEKSGSVLTGDEKGNDLIAEELGTLARQKLEAIDERRKIEALYNAALRANNASDVIDDKGTQVAEELRKSHEERVSKLDDQLRELDKEIGDLEVEKKELLVKYTLEFPKVQQIIAKIDERKSFRTRTENTRRKGLNDYKVKVQRQVTGDIRSALAAKLRAARGRENQFEASYQRAVIKANQQGIDVAKLTTLKREIETKRNLLDTYIQRQKEKELLLEGDRPDNISISANAVVPTDPIGPNRNRNILITFLVSLLGGIGLSFLIDYLDDSIRTSDDVGRSLGLPTLALIPHHANFERKNKKMITAGENGIAPSLALIALEDNRSAMAEAYRHLRTSLLFSSAGKPPETILVTSSQPSEGKTTTAINTAITLAQSGADVVLIDCDLRRPRLHNHFNMENSHGLTNYLSGEKETDNLLKPVPSLPRLKIITSGPIPPNPAELLSSNEMKHLLQFLKGNHKHIVIDSPPAISFTDAAILSTLVDGVVLVAMAGKSSVHLMRRFKQRLGNIGARIYGVVLNGIKPNSIEYGYYGYGYTYSYYNLDDEDDSTPRMEDSKALIDDFIDDDYIEEETDESISVNHKKD